MFSLDKFYYILYKNLLEPINAVEGFYYPFGSSDVNDLCDIPYSKNTNYRLPRILFFDQEPLFEKPIDDTIAAGAAAYKHPRIMVLANSEISALKKSICKKYGWSDWYYFFHGFAALSWYNDFQYLPQDDPGFSKVFINLNNLMTQDRSYRMHLVALMIEHQMLEHGLVSLPLYDKNGTWKSEVFSPHCKLSTSAKKTVASQLMKLNGPLVVDTDHPQGWLSAEINLPLMHQALWHVVSETIFFQEKLHLTEKIFKPIVSKRPFILVAAPGNLAYLKSYGFKTFDRWIDESYDDELDPDKRITKIVHELKRLCSMRPEELKQMHEEMKPYLEYNFQHMYTGFKKKIVYEMVDNFEVCLRQYNNSHLPVSQIPVDIDFERVKRRLLGDW